MKNPEWKNLSNGVKAEEYFGAKAINNSLLNMVFNPR